MVEVRKFHGRMAIAPEILQWAKIVMASLRVVLEEFARVPRYNAQGERLFKDLRSRASGEGQPDTTKAEHRVGGAHSWIDRVVSFSL